MGRKSDVSGPIYNSYAHYVDWTSTPMLDATLVIQYTSFLIHLAYKFYSHLYISILSYVGL